MKTVECTNLGQSDTAEKIRRQKRLVGVIAIILITIFFILTFLNYIGFLVMLVLDIVVWGIANLILRRIGRTPL